MSQRDQKTHEKSWAQREKPAPQQEEEYDLYLFWPSLSNRDVSSGDTPSSPLYGVWFLLLPSLSRLPTVLTLQPVSLHSESIDYDSSMLGSGPPVRSVLCIRFKNNLFISLSLQ